MCKWFHWSKEGSETLISHASHLQQDALQDVQKACVLCTTSPFSPGSTPFKRGGKGVGFRASNPVPFARPFGGHIAGASRGL